MKDIETRADIDRLMNEFYEEVMADKRIGYIFTDIAHLDLERHLPIIGDFWESLLFGTPSYSAHKRNPLQVHLQLHQMANLTRAHFERWLDIFGSTVDKLFVGERSEFLKTRASAIARRMIEFLDIGPEAATNE